MATSHLINILPTKNLQFRTPYSKLYNKPPNYSHLRSFGCLFFPHLQHSHFRKFAPRSEQCIFISYPLYTKSYLCYNLSMHKILTSRHVIFHESEFPFLKHSHNEFVTVVAPNKQVQASAPLTLVPTSYTPTIATPCSPSPTPLLTEPAPSTLPQVHLTTPPSHFILDFPKTAFPKQAPNRPTKFHPMTTRLETRNIKPKHIMDLQHSVRVLSDPVTYKEATQHSHWIDAMDAEYSTLMQQQTWTFVPPPSDHTILGYRWMYKTKIHADGTIARHKVCLVAQGYRQQEGVEFFETFSPVAKITTVRMFITLDVHHN